MSTRSDLFIAGKSAVGLDWSWPPFDIMGVKFPTIFIALKYIKQYCLIITNQILRNIAPY
jgi:hypothetical protein